MPNRTELQTLRLAGSPWTSGGLQLTWLWRAASFPGPGTGTPCHPANELEEHDDPLHDQVCKHWHWKHLFDIAGPLNSKTSVLLLQLPDISHAESHLGTVRLHCHLESGQQRVQVCRYALPLSLHIIKQIKQVIWWKLGRSPACAFSDAL